MTRFFKSAGQLTYELDYHNRPLYHDGQPRKSWSDLHEVAKYSWQRNPTQR